MSLIQDAPIEALAGFCDEHGEFHFVGQSSGYCPVVREKWGSPTRCNFRTWTAEPRTLAHAEAGLRDALALLEAHRG